MNDEEEKINQNKKVILSVMSLVLLVVIVIGITYAAFSYTKKGKVVNTIRTGKITMTYTEGENGISITDALPMEDSVGMRLSDPGQTFDFNVGINVTGSTNINYEVTAEKDETSTLANNDVRIYLERSTDGTTYSAVGTPNGYNPMGSDDSFGATAEEMLLDTSSLGTSTPKYYYRLRMWVSSSYEVSSEERFFTVKINVYGSDGISTTYTDPSGANAPELRGDMIPVTYDSASKNWVKADTKSAWYSYNDQDWANAVTIANSSKRATYAAADPGTPITMSDINTMWVWIPRYSYTLGNTYGVQGYGGSTPSIDTPGAFDIKFVKKETIDTGSGQYTGDSPANYYTPASFCWGDTCDTNRRNAANTELSGIWVSKFEITGNIDSITSIPNADSVRDQTHSAFFNAVKTQMNGSTGTSTYGFSGDYDTHMMKNIEWGAMAYLSQSKYGKYGNTDFTGANKEVYINNYYSVPNSEVGGQTLTGCSAGHPGTGENDSRNHITICTYTYDVDGSGTGASTTGKITGIYDTAGGAWEKMMGNYQGLVASSGFTEGTMPAQRYWNRYNGDIGIKGDATNADGTVGFYGDIVANPVDSTRSFSARCGGWYGGPVAGNFYFNSDPGSASYFYGSRLTLVAW